MDCLPCRIKYFIMNFVICGPPSFSHIHIPFAFQALNLLGVHALITLEKSKVEILLIELDYESPNLSVVIDSVRTQQIFSFESHLTSPFVRVSTKSFHCCEFVEKMKIIFLPSSPSLILLHLSFLPLPAITLREFCTSEEKVPKGLESWSSVFVPSFDFREESFYCFLLVRLLFTFDCLLRFSSQEGSRIFTDFMSAPCQTIFFVTFVYFSLSQLVPSFLYIFLLFFFHSQWLTEAFFSIELMVNVWYEEISIQFHKLTARWWWNRKFTLRTKISNYDFTL